MKRVRHHITFFRVLFAFFAVVGVGVYGVTQLPPTGNAYAGAEVVGNPDGASVRALISNNGTDRVNRIIYFQQGVKTMQNTTPVASGTICGQAGDLHWAKVTLNGTMTGTNPTLSIKWQNSKDNGVTWSDVGTWTDINATTTPPSQEQTVADIRASTAVAYGDCWRATYTFGGTGTVTADFSIIGIEK